MSKYARGHKSPVSASWKKPLLREKGTRALPDPLTHGPLLPSQLSVRHTFARAPPSFPPHTPHLAARLSPATAHGPERAREQGAPPLPLTMVQMEAILETVIRISIRAAPSSPTQSQRRAGPGESRQRRKRAARRRRRHLQRLTAEPARAPPALTKRPVAALTVERASGTRWLRLPIWPSGPTVPSPLSLLAGSARARPCASRPFFRPHMRARARAPGRLCGLNPDFAGPRTQPIRFRHSRTSALPVRSCYSRS